MPTGSFTRAEHEAARRIHDKMRTMPGYHDQRMWCALTEPEKRHLLEFAREVRALT